MSERGSERPELRDRNGRRLLEPPLRRLLKGVVAAAPEQLGHVDPDRIVLVAGAAQRGARASIRPLSFGGSPPSWSRGAEAKPKVQIGGRIMLYELCLRPRYFLATPPEERLRVLVHELWHVASSFDGSLDPDRRHPLSDPAGAEAFLDAVIARCSDVDSEILAHDGELRVPMWLDRPVSIIPAGVEARRLHDRRDLFLGIVRQTSGEG